jgi:hypothetical protein
VAEISKQQETCGSIFSGSVWRYSPSGYHRYEDLVRFGYELNMALENFKHLSLIFGYLLGNHVWKSEDFSLNLFEFWLLRISKSI